MNFDKEKWDAFLKLMRDALWLAAKAYNCSFNYPENGKKEDKCSALSYAAACTARYSAAESLYWATPEIWNGDIPKLFAQFGMFVIEVQSDFEQDHPRGQVEEYFNRLKEAFEDSVCNQPYEN